MKHHQEMLPVMISFPTFDHGDWVCSTWTEGKGLPSGNLLHSYWKLPFIVDLATKNGDFLQLC